IAALVGTGGVVLWRKRADIAARVVLAATVLGTAIWAFVLLDRSADFVPWLRYAVLAGGIASALLLAGISLVPGRVAAFVAALAVVTALAGPAAYAVQTASTAHTGSIPSAGPAVAGARGGGPGGMPGMGQLRGTRPPMAGAGTFHGPPQGTAGGPGGNAGGLLNGSTPTAALTKLLEADAASYTWVAAAVGSNTASGYQLATGDPVMAIGGFNGSDPSPTLAEFQADVAAGRIHYFIAGGAMGGAPGGSGSNTSSEISSWVEANYSPTTVGGVTLYDLSGGAA
ncbi:MAG: glycosyl transferase, partial [Propionibacteriales bacterium]|nr:glycosyl transferase [Propionibacteriales bacterium]